MNATFMAAFRGGKATRFEGQYCRTTPRMETGDPRYAWVNHSLFVGGGRAIEGLGVEYRVHRVA